MIEQELQQKYIQLQLLDQQIKQFQQQILALEQQILEFRTVQDSLDNISKTKSNTNILTPLGIGIFAEASLNNNKEVLMNVGSKVVVKKPIIEAQEIIKTQTIEIENIIKSFQTQLASGIEMAMSLNKEIETLTSKSKKK